MGPVGSTGLCVVRHGCLTWTWSQPFLSPLSAGCRWPEEGSNYKHPQGLGLLEYPSEHPMVSHQQLEDDAGRSQQGIPQTRL